MAWVALAILGLSSAPLWEWWWQRQSDEEPCLLLLLPLAWTLSRPPAAQDWRVSALLLWTQALLAPWLPRLGRAVLFALALGCFLSRWRNGRAVSLPVAGLCLLALPGLSSTQFLLGYPFRALAAQLAALLLRGYGVVAEGVSLSVGGQPVVVDAPCSGLRMTWLSLALVLALAWKRNWRIGATLRWSCISLVGMVLANGWRVASLFVLSRQNGPDWMHEGIGLVIFGGAVLALATLSPPSTVEEPPTPGPRRGLKWLLAGALLNLVPYPAAPPRAVQPSTWPSYFEGRALIPVPLDAAEARFYLDFPGSLARFTDGRHQLLVRYITQVTRKLHDSSDCFRGLGYRIEHQALWRDPQDVLWRTYDARRGAESLKVRERIYSAEGNWTDVSQWFWTAGRGPWWSLCVVSKVR